MQPASVFIKTKVVIFKMGSGRYSVVLLFLSLLLSIAIRAQSVSFALKTSPNITFDFNTIQKYENGITIMNACTLNIEATGTQWDLYVGATTTNIGYWDVTNTYGSTGSLPTIGILKLQFRNAAATSLVSGFFSLQDISTPTYIIGTSAAPDAAISCPNLGTNTAGSYLTNPSCYKFNIDLRITPGFSLRPGLYTLRIDYVIIQDL